MKRFVRRAAVIAAFVAAPLLAAAPAHAAMSRTSAPSAEVMAGYENEVVRLTNVERTGRGCPALRIDDRLVKAARAHSTDMVAARFFSHTGSDGSTFVAREVAAGYPKRSASAENIAWGYRTPKAVGVGVAYNAGGAPYWTQDFGRI